MLLTALEAVEVEGNAAAEAVTVAREARAPRGIKVLENEAKVVPKVSSSVEAKVDKGESSGAAFDAAAGEGASVGGSLAVARYRKATL